MKSAAIYISPTQTTKRGVQAMAKKIAAIKEIEFVDYDVTLPEYSRQKATFSKEDFVVVGAPVYGGRIYHEFLHRMEGFQGDDTPCIITVTYGNRHYDDAMLELSDFMKERGFRPIAGAAVIGEHTYGDIQKGRPDANDIKEDEEFIEKVLEKGDYREYILPGRRPFREEGSAGSFIPITDDSCIQCGICANRCPMGAISKEDGTSIDEGKCISCFSCIRVCPTGAKNMDTPAYNEFAEKFSKWLAIPRKNEYFY